MNTQALLIRFIFVTVLAFLLIPVDRVQAAPGDLDTSFGIGGMVATDISQSAGFVRRVRIQPDGKIVTLGHSLGWGYLPSGFFMTRHSQDGSVDTSFGTNGVKTFTYPFLGYDYLNDFVVLPDGKIIITGARYYLGSNSDVFLYRLNGDGSVDGTFGTNGSITTTSGGGPVGRKILRQPDGKIVVAGITDYGIIVLRCNLNGQLDPGFGTNGIGFFPISTDPDYTVFGSGFVEEGINELLVQPDGKILVGASSNYDFALVRFDANGHPDGSFGAGGLVITDVSNRPNYLNGIALQTDGKIVINGLNQTVYEEALESSALLRYNTDGTLDRGFGTDGVALIAESDQNSRGLASALAIQPDGKILTAGSKDGVFAIARYKSNGTVDTQFGTNGVLRTQVGPNPGGTILSLAWQPDGKLVAAGSLLEASHKVGLVRYLGNDIVRPINIEELYAAVNDPNNVGMQIVISPGVYNLSVNAPNGVARPNGGRLELQENMSLTGTVGDRSAVVIDAANLPASSYSAPPVTTTGPIRMGKGSNSLEWLTVRNAVNGQAGVEADLIFPGTAFVRIAHITSTGNARGIDVRNFGAAAAGAGIEADIVDCDLVNNTLGLAEGMRFANLQGANSSVINARLTGNRSHGNQNGMLVVNNRSNNASVSVVSSSDRFYENGSGAVVVGGLSSNSTAANGNTTNFEARGSYFEDNNAFTALDKGGLVILGGENTSIPNGVSNNTVNITLRGCRLGNNQLYDLAAFGARSNPVSAGLPGTNDRINVKLYGTQPPVLVTDDSIPDTAVGVNSVIVTNVPPITVSGRILTPTGLGLRGATVSLIDSQGVRNTRTTSSFGFYEFNNIAADETYTLSVSSKRYRFATQSVNVAGNMTNVDFVGLE